MEIQKRELAAATLYVGQGGATISAVTEVGEVLFDVGYAPGIHRLERLREHIASEDHLILTGDGTIRQKGGRLLAISHGRHGVESGANPDFRPTRASDAEIAARKLLVKINAQGKALEKRMATLRRLEEERPGGVADVIEEPEETQVEEVEEPERKDGE